MIVSWEDAQHDSDFSGKPEEAGETSLCHTIGFLVKKTKKIVVLAMDIDPKENTIRFILTVPAKLVQNITYLGPKSDV